MTAATPTAPTPTADPIRTDPDLYRVVFENDRVRVLEYRDRPGERTHRHDHPDMVIVPLADFRRRLTVDGRTVEVDKRRHEAGWVPAQSHVGENIGDTASHALFVELK